MAYERITIDPVRMRGLPCIRDTRMTVSAVLGQLAAGRTADEVLADYPYLERADILAALEFAADAVQEHELPLAQPRSPVRLLIDANLSPRVAATLRDAGHEAVHVADIGMLAASDDAILAHAAAAGQVIVSADTDFGELLAVAGAVRPSVVLLRSADHLTPAATTGRA